MKHTEFLTTVKSTKKLLFCKTCLCLNFFLRTFASSSKTMLTAAMWIHYSMLQLWVIYWEIVRYEIKGWRLKSGICPIVSCTLFTVKIFISFKSDQEVKIIMNSNTITFLERWIYGIIMSHNNKRFPEAWIKIEQACLVKITHPIAGVHYPTMYNVHVLVVNLNLFTVYTDKQFKCFAVD